jgi:hypothetical protein
MKRLPRVPVWLILLPLVTLAFTAWFGPAAAGRFMAGRQAYAAAPVPRPATSAQPTPTAQDNPSAQSSRAQPTHACPPPGHQAQGGKDWQDLPWGGLWFDLADLEYAGAQNCAPHGHGPPPWSQGWNHGHGWGHERHGFFHPTEH